MKFRVVEVINKKAYNSYYIEYKKNFLSCWHKLPAIIRNNEEDISVIDTCLSSLADAMYVMDKYKETFRETNFAYIYPVFTLIDNALFVGQKSINDCKEYLLSIYSPKYLNDTNLSTDVFPSIDKAVGFRKRHIYNYEQKIFYKK